MRKCTQPPTFQGRELTIYFFKCICLKGQSYREREEIGESRRIIHSQVHHPNGCHGQGSASRKPGAWNYIRICHTGSRRSPHLGLPFAVFQVHETGAGVEVEQPEFKPAFIWDASISGHDLSHCSTVLTPRVNKCHKNSNNTKNKKAAV